MNWNTIAALGIIFFFMGIPAIGSIYHYYRYERTPQVPRRPLPASDHCRAEQDND
ncbi:hypothetical protein AFAE65S_00131 [Alcaligenes phenolicus]